MSEKKPPVDPREAGRRGGIASGEARRKRRSRSFMDALKARVNSNPEELVEGLLGSAAGAVTAARVLEKTGFFEPPKPEPVDVGNPAITGLLGVVELAYRTGQAANFGLPVTVAQFEELLATGEEAAEESRNPASSPSHVPDTSVEGGGLPTEDRNPAPPPAPPKSTWEAEQRAIYQESRATLGLEPDDFVDPPRPSRPRFIEPEWEI